MGCNDGTPTKLHNDTGAEVTVISEQVWREVDQPALSAPGRTLRGPDNHELPTVGKFSASFKRGVTAEVYIVKGLHKPLLGRPAIEKLRLLSVSHIATVDNSDDLTPTARFPQLFKGLGKLQGCYKIKL